MPAPRVNRFVSRLRPRASRALLPPDTARALDRASASGDLYLRARRLVEGLYQGRHRTPHRGASTEFYDFRPYTPGDPLSRVDWKLFGRTDRYFVRRFHQDAQLTVTLIVDASASMDFASVDAGGGAGAGATKYRRAQELAAALAFLAARQGDRVGLILVGGMPVDGGVRAEPGPRVIPPASGWPALHACVEALESTVPSPAPARGEGEGGRGTLARGFEAATHLLRDRGLVIALGDALEDADALLGAAALLRSAGREGSAARRVRRDVGLVHLLTRDELELPPMSAAARFIDPESSAVVRTSPRAVAERYTSLIHEHCDALRLGLLSLAGRYVLATPADEPVEMLRRLITA